MVSKSQSPSRRVTRQSSKSPSRRQPSKSPASTAKRAASKSPSRKQAKPASKSPSRAQPTKASPPARRSSKSPTRSSTRVKTQKAPEKPSVKPAKAEVPSSRYYSSESAKREEYRPSRTMFPDESKARREYITPLGVADADEQRGAYQRRMMQQTAAAPPMEEARKKRKQIIRARVNAFIDGVQANISKFRYLYGFLVLLTLLFWGVYYTGYKVNQGIKHIQAQLNQYVSHVATSYFQKEEPKNRSE